MANQKRPGPLNPEEHPVAIDDGTMPRVKFPAPPPVGTGLAVPLAAPSRPASWLDPQKVTESMSVSLDAETSWNSVTGEIYKRAADAIARQAGELMRNGHMSPREAVAWANGQRNAMIQATRDESSPIGRAVVGLLTPQSKLRSLRDLEALGKSATGIIESAVRANLFVNRVVLAFKYGGPALLVVQISFFAYRAATAPISGMRTAIGTVAGFAEASETGDFVYRIVDAEVASQSDAVGLP